MDPRLTSCGCLNTLKSAIGANSLRKKGHENMHTSLILA